MNIVRALSRPKCEPRGTAQYGWPGGHGRWYPGTISGGPNSEGTYSIAYDDGDLEDKIPMTRIKKVIMIRFDYHYYTIHTWH